MWKWVWEGMRKGIVTTAYPAREETASGVTPGFPAGLPRTFADSEQAEAVAACCPTAALVREDRQVFFRDERCIHCYRCLRLLTSPLKWESQGNYEWAASPGFQAEMEKKFRKSFRRSLHLRVIDAGACGACLSEIEQLNKPYYNMHRLGFFLTPTPREADVLLVAGPVTDHMRQPLLKAYDAMPDPKGVLALGACAIFGGIFGSSFASRGEPPAWFPWTCCSRGVHLHPWLSCTPFWPWSAALSPRCACPPLRLREVRSMFNLNSLFFLFLILCATGVVLAATLPARRNPVALAWIGSLASLTLLLLSGNILLSGHPFQIKLWQVFSLGQMLLQDRSPFGVVHLLSRNGISSRLHIHRALHEPEKISGQI